MAHVTTLPCRVDVFNKMLAAVVSSVIRLFPSDLWGFILMLSTLFKANPLRSVPPELSISVSKMQLVLLITLAVIALLCKTTDCQGNGETSTIVSTRTFVKGECGTKTYICDSCTSRQPCIAGQEIEASFPCASGTFCNEGTAFDRCGPTPSAACVTSTETASFTCTSTGVLPDPNNCNNYHVCLTVGASSTEYNCPPGYVFSIASSSCIRQMTAANCVTVACTPRVPSYVLYGTSRVYYAICDGVNRPTQILRCPNGALFTYFSNSSRFGECVYTCSGQGNYPNSNNPSTYFQCYISSGRLVYNEIDCPQNTIFNQTLRYCTNP